MPKPAKPPDPETVTRYRTIGLTFAKRAEADKVAKDADGADVVEVTSAVYYDVVSDELGDGFEGRYNTKALAGEHVARLEDQAAGGDWRGPRPTWRVRPVELELEEVG